VDLADFDYDLPAGAIAQAPTESRDGSRLLVIDRARSSLGDRRVAELPALLRAGDCLVVNDSRVIPARVLAEDAAGKPVELLFVEPVSEGAWRAMVRPGRRCRPGVHLRAGAARLRVVAADEDGTRLIVRENGAITALLETAGMPPLPPYIARHAKPAPEDWERYQTVYARTPGSVAAPTAGLHFSDALLERLRAAGVEIHALTLHVGPATFRPITAPAIESHTLPSERAVASAATAEAVNAARGPVRREQLEGHRASRGIRSPGWRRRRSRSGSRR